MDAREEQEHRLQVILKLSRYLLYWVYEILVPAERRLPFTFWLQYDERQQTFGLCATLFLWIHSGYQNLPREFQLTATMAMVSGQDSLIDVGTGAGKTLCMILPCWLAPDTMAIVFSPLKRLQAAQVLEFSRYKIKAIAINEDTPNDPNLWKDIRNGVYAVLIVQPEQLYYMSNGRLPRLARLVSEDRHFVKLIRRVHVDEAHFIYTAGLKHYGLPASRPAWARIGEFLIKLRKPVPVQALSDTQPPHIKAAIIENLLMDETRLCSVKLTSNRPNIVYATHPIVGDLSDFRNLDFLIPRPCPTGWSIPKTIVFHDSAEQAAEATSYHIRRLPDDLRKSGLVMHYHGIMSKQYLTQVYEDSSNPDGHCRVLHAAEDTSMRLDIPDIEVIVQYGVTDVPTALQRAGQGGRSPMGKAIFLVMYEPWAKTIDLTTVNIDTASDPDHPNVPTLTLQSTKQNRTDVAMIKMIQLEQECLRQLFASYLGDMTFNALHFSNKWCCNRHPKSDFHWGHFFKGQLLYQDPESSRLYYGGVDDPEREEILPPEKKKLKGSIKVRAANERRQLITRLLAWRVVMHSNDPLAGVRPPSFVLDDGDIKVLARLHPSDVTHSEQIVTALDQTQEWKDHWSHQIFDVIRTYDRELADYRKAKAARDET